VLQTLSIRMGGRLGICASCLLALHGVAQADSILRIAASTTSASAPQLPNGERLASISETSVNRFGTIALGASTTFAGVTGSSIVIGRAGQPLERISFAPSSTRQFASVQINDAGDVVARDRVSGSPPVFLVRLWRSGGSFNILESTNDGAFGGLVLPSLANDGSVSFVGLAGSALTSGLYVNRFSVRGDHEEVLTPLTGAGSRPAIADGRQIVVRGGQPGKEFIDFAQPSGGIFGGYVVRNITGPTFTAIGATPGITEKGKFAAYYGVDASGPGIFLSDVTNTRAEPQRVISLGDKVNTFASIGGNAPVTRTLQSLTPGSKVAVEVLSTASEQQLRIVFTGVDSNGDTSLFSARVDKTSGRVYDRSALAVVGGRIRTSDGVTSSAITQFGAADPITPNGHLAFNATLASGEQLATTGVMQTFTKYKQANHDGNVFNLPTSPMSWSTKSINPTSSAGAIFANRGCYQTSLATLAGFYGIEYTPLEIRDLLASQKLLEDDGGINIDTFKASAFRIAPGKGLSVSGRGGTFDDIVKELRAGTPVLLGVPDSKYMASGVSINNGAANNLHAIVAYGLDPAVAKSGAVDASQIFISDPGSSNYYRNHYMASYTPGEQLGPVNTNAIHQRSERS